MLVIVLSWYPCHYYREMSHRKFRLTTPKNWERKKYEKRSEDSLTSKDLDVSNSGPLMVKIPQQYADVALLTLQASRTVFDGMYATVNSLRLCKMEHKESTSRVVMTLELKIGVCSLLVECKQVKLSPEKISTLEEFIALVQMIDRHTICRGISDERFAALITKHGGTFVDPYGMQCVVYVSINLILCIFYYR